MTWLVLGLILFLGVHSIRMAVPGLRTVFEQSWGDNIWKGVYSVPSLLGLVLIVVGYGQVRSDGVIIYGPLVGAGVIALLMFPALILLIAGNTPKGRIKALVKHPMTLAVVIWSFAHLLVNGELASLILFGSFFVWSLALYFQSLTRGETNDVEPKIKHDVVAIAVGTGLYLALVLALHEWLFGVAPIL